MQQFLVLSWHLPIGLETLLKIEYEPPKPRLDQVWNGGVVNMDEIENAEGPGRDSGDLRLWRFGAATGGAVTRSN